MSCRLSWTTLHSIGDAYAINIALVEELVLVDWFGICLPCHIVSSYIHMHNDQISYSNDIEFFIYQTSGHLANLGSGYILYHWHLQDFCLILLLKNLFLYLWSCFSPCLYHGLWMIVLRMHLPMMFVFCWVCVHDWWVKLQLINGKCRHVCVFL